MVFQDSLSDDFDEDAEEGEILEEEEVTPYTRPIDDNRPLCRHFQRGRCNWGEACKWLHPGVNDQGELY